MKPIQPPSKWEIVKQNWNEISPLGRIAVGGILAFAIYYGINAKFIEPLRAEKKTQKTQLTSTQVPHGYEFMIQNIRQQQLKCQAETNAIKNDIERLQKASQSLSIHNCQSILAQIRTLATRHNLNLLHEAEIESSQIQTKPPTANTKTTSQPRSSSYYYDDYATPTVNETYYGIQLPAAMAQKGYTLNLTGNFNDIQNFINDANALNLIFQIKNLKFTRTNVMKQNGQYHYVPMTGLEFQLYIPYFKSGAVQ